MDKLKSELNYLVTDEHLEEYTGKRAQILLETKKISELKYLDPRRGVVRVDKERWEEAQRYERRTWMEKCKDMVSDHNEDNCKRFENFSLLKDLRFERAIELGCGPFTNMRLILEYIDVEEVYLLDPLINSYLNHAYCSYRRNRLVGMIKNLPTWHDFEKPIRFLKRKLHEYRIGGFRGRPVNLIGSTIEAYQTNLKFDFVVMINVIEHCQDVDVVFGKILEIIQPGGILVYGDVMYEADEVMRLSSVHYDAGHPLRVTPSVIESLLTDNFDTLMRDEFVIEHSNITKLKNTKLYFIGKRKPFCL